MATLAMFFRRPLAAPDAASRGVQTAFIPADDRYFLRPLPNEDVFLFSKPIDNSRIVRLAPATAKSEWSTIGTACVAAALFMGLSIPRMANVIDGYKLESLKQEQQHLLDEQRDLDIVEARLSRQENLEAAAKRRDMGIPAPGQVVHLDPKSDSKLALNRH